jgi:mono/diheme cytochrome c family protein
VFRNLKYGWLAILVVLGSLIFEIGSAGRQAAPAPNSQASAGRTFERTPERLARGRYLVEGVVHCPVCHSETDWKTPGIPPLPGRKNGGTRFPEETLSWIIAPNISPDPETGSGTWTDEQFARAIREGIGHDGRRLFPLMPYLTFRSMSDEDLASVVVYERSLPPVHNPLPKTVMPEEMKKLIPPYDTLTQPVPPPDLSTPVKRGAYLAQLANCAGCHTPTDENLQPIPGLDFAGGAELKGPWGDVASQNITPDSSGIGYYDEARFIQTIRTGHVGARKLSLIMLWGYYRNMTDKDLKAIFAYLRTLKPVKHRVDNTEPAKYCKLCRGKHGYGERNF